LRVILECVRLQVEEREKEETMRAVTVFRWDEGRKAKEPVGVVFEKRKTERGSNYMDLLRLARKLFAMSRADAVHVIIDLGYTRRTIPTELARDGSAG